MKTEFLKELGLEQSVIDKIMAENGKDVESHKQRFDIEQEGTVWCGEGVLWGRMTGKRIAGCAGKGRE